MNCPHCGKETKGPLFCEYCGASLESLPSPAPQPDRHSPVPHWIWIAGGLGVVAILLLIGLTAVIFIIARPSATSTTATSTQVTLVSPLPTLTPVTPQGQTPVVKAYYVNPYLVTNKQYIDYLYEMDPDQMNKQWGPNFNMGPEDEPAG